MRIGIDNISVGLGTSRTTGGGLRLFFNETMNWFKRVAPQHEYVLFQPDWADPLDLESGGHVELWTCRGVPRNRIGRVLFEQTVYPMVIDRSGVDVFLGSCNVLPLRLKVPSAVVMHSLQYFNFPQTYSWANRVYLRTIVPLSLLKANRIIALSNFSKKTIMENVVLPGEKIHVVHTGISSQMQLKREGVNYEQGVRLVNKIVKGKPYILSVSSFYWIKNLPKLIEAFALLKRNLNVPHLLLLVGADSIKVTRQRLLELASKLGVRDQVICPGVIAHHLLPAFYVNAELTAMPSLYETFGNPVFESMGCGCPVVTSREGTMAEIAQDSAVLVDPYDIESIAAGMARVLKEPDLRQQMITSGLIRIQAFTREAQACGYLKAIKEAFDEGTFKNSGTQIKSNSTVS